MMSLESNELVIPPEELRPGDLILQAQSTFKAESSPTEFASLDNKFVNCLIVGRPDEQYASRYATPGSWKVLLIGGLLDDCVGFMWAAKLRIIRQQ